MTAFGAVLSDQLLTQQFIITGNQFRRGVTAPTEVTIGTTPTIDALRFSGILELVSTYLIMPFNWDRTVDPELILVWSLVNAETNGDAINVTMDYTAPIALSTGDGIAKTSTQLTDSRVLTTGEGLAAGDIYGQTFTFDRNDANNPLANAQGFAVEFHLTNVATVADIDLIAACMNYQELH